MSGWSIPFLISPDIETLTRKGDISGLIRLLSRADFTTQWRITEVLGRSGSGAVPFLLDALRSPDIPLRLCVIDALTEIRDVRSVDTLISVLEHDPITEARWAAAIALGELGSPKPVPTLVRMLRDKNHYIRYGSALSLRRLGWEPDNEKDSAYESIALQDWGKIRTMEADATGPLLDILKDDDPSTRTTLVALLNKTRGLGEHRACAKALRDRDPGVRWEAVQASMNCGIASSRIPLVVAGRERTGPNPWAAALLNFLFLGLGYNYIGKWWGFPVFMVYMTIFVLAQLAAGPFIPYLVGYPFTGLLAIQTFYIARRMNES